jgi:hypothetical protein
MKRRSDHGTSNSKSRPVGQPQTPGRFVARCGEDCQSGADADLEHGTSYTSPSRRPVPARGASVYLEGQFHGAAPRPRGH